MHAFCQRAKSWIGHHRIISLGAAALGVAGLAWFGVSGFWQLAVLTTAINIGSSVDLPSTAPPPAAEAPAPAESLPESEKSMPKTPAVGTELDRALDRLERGSLAFNAPERMKVTEQFRVRVLLKPGDDIEALRRALGTEEGRIETGRDVRISNVMQARLSGPGFRIDPPEAVEQPISAVESTEWQWWITALAPGQQSLTLALYAKVVVDGQERARLIKTFERTVEVAVAPKSWLDQVNDAIEPWQKLLGAIVAFVAAAAGLYAWWRKRNAKPPRDES